MTKALKKNRKQGRQKEKIKQLKLRKQHNFLLFKNATKQAFRNKIQLIGLAILVLLSSTIFSLMQTSLTRVVNQYDALIAEDQSNIHDFVLDFYNTAKKTNDLAEHPSNIEEPVGVVEDQQLYLNEIANNADNSFIWDRVEARTFQLNNNNDAKVLKLITYNKNARIDKLVISYGFNIGDPHNDNIPLAKQTVVNKEFANKNNLKIGDVIRIQADTLGDSLKVDYDITNSKYDIYNWLKIVGFGSSADFITPIIDQTTPLPNKNREGILYVDPITFGFADRINTDNNFLWYYNKPSELFAYTSDKDREIYYVGKSTMVGKNDLTKISKFFTERYVNISDSSAPLVYQLGDSNYRFNNRTSTLYGTIQAFKTLLIILLLIVLVITGITVVLITFKNIDNSKPQIGILKSLGYSNWRILFTSLAYPTFAALIGTIFVFFPASGLQILVVNTFSNYFNLNFGHFVFDGLGYLYCLLLTFGFLSIIAWIISAITVIKNPIDLIKNISISRDSKFTRFVKKTSINAKFLTRFRLALFTSSIGKMLAVFLTMFMGTILMTTAIIGPKIMSDNQKVTYTGMNYKNLTEYVNPTYNSPFSFYKTYNPTIQPWEYTTNDDGNYTYPVRDDKTYAEELIDNSINSEAYAPINYDPQDASSISNLGLYGLTYLYGKMLTKDFMNGLDKSTTSSFLFPFIIQMAWPDGLPMYNLASQSDIYSDNNYQIVRTFYINYRSTITMDLNPEVSADNNKNQIDITNFTEFVKNAKGWQDDPDNFPTELSNFKFDTTDKKYPWHIADEKELLDNPIPINEGLRNQWIRKTLIWYYSLFYNRVGKAVAQGAYSRSPYFVRQNIAKAFEDPNDRFNISFNVIPFDKKNDELGTYFVGTPDKKFNNKQYPIKIYGLQSEKELQRPSLMQLYNSNGHSLNDALERSQPNEPINIVINQTIAKQLRLKENQTFRMSSNGNILKTNQDPEHQNEYTAIEVDKINFNNINNEDNDEVPPGENNATLKTQYTKFEQNENLNTDSKGAYQSLGNNATPMSQEIFNGHIVIDHDTDMQEFKVAGIYNGYGQPTAYISKTNADRLLHFDQAKQALYKIFKQEWQTKIVEGINFNYLTNHDYKQFNEETDDSEPFLRLKTIFNNEFPIFNFKLSKADELFDVTQAFSISQAYGDYSAIGMNGGSVTAAGTTTNYPVYGEGTAVNILPLYIHKQLLEQITQLVDTVLLFFIVFSLIISFFIILLTSNLVIYENRRIIATMKILGYSDAKITNIVIGMYIPIILATWIIGVPLGWIIVNIAINYLAFNTTWVLPLIFTWWLPIIVGLIVLGIYAITFVIEWQTTKKIKPLIIMNESN